MIKIGNRKLYLNRQKLQRPFETPQNFLKNTLSEILLKYHKLKNTERYTIVCHIKWMKMRNSINISLLFIIKYFTLSKTHVYGKFLNFPTLVIICLENAITNIISKQQI
jgi:hypothetical protein